MGIRETVKAILTGRNEYKYRKRLRAARMTYEEWCGERPAPRSSVLNAHPEFQVLVLEDGEVDVNCNKRLAAFWTQHPEVLLVYGDEDRMGANQKPEAPIYRPDWAPDTFLSQGTLGGLVAVRKDWYESLAEKDKTLDRMVALAGGFEKGCTAIGHISEILFHRKKEADSGEESDRKEAANGQRAILPQETAPQEIPSQETSGCAAKSSRDEAEMLSVIIPSKDHPEILAQCVKSLVKTLGDIKCEILVVDNGSQEENRLKVEELLEQLPAETSYLYLPMAFHFARMCNLAAEKARGKYLLFLNDDVELRCPGWAQKMLEKAAKPYVGAVGLKLCYPNSCKIQHAGIVNLPMGPVHKLQFLEDTGDWYEDYHRIDRNVLAVTGACLMVAAEKYEAAGCMCEELPVAFNDVDLCFTLWEMGYHNVVINSSYAWHHESLSRGEDESREKLARLLEEKQKLYRRHPALAKGEDPYYSVHLNREGLDTGIRPGYLCGRNVLQQGKSKAARLDLSVYRNDACLLFRVEECEPEKILGYGVVLGDHNACYDKQLVLYGVASEAEWEPTGEISCYLIDLKEQYRPELAENMPDQTCVALCGFAVCPETANLPQGNYRLGMIAKSRVGGTRLIRFSSRVLKIANSTE